MPLSPRREEGNQLIPAFVKVQCMHREDPACVPACIVPALNKEENGAVRYEVPKCINCRYCMIACPFQIPAHEYHDPLTPSVMKGDFLWQESAFQKGMKAAGLPYSGKYKGVDTVMYWGLTREVMPAKNALGCTQCHESLKREKNCNRCHRDSRDVDFRKLVSMGTDFARLKSRGRGVSRLVGVTDYLDFKALWVS
ncbi:MAG: hypothetical protein JXL84_21310 [Deltaproteobacteria bacterium]|nr:hypothetical protein [Deltaproteobacteria bacterium]